MKQHYSVLGKKVSESGHQTDVQHCLRHGDLSAPEDSRKVWLGLVN